MGCGKSTVAQILKTDHALPVVSADEVALSLLKEKSELHRFVFDKMGIQPPLKISGVEETLNDDFKRYRTEIASKVFNKPELLKEYELFFHPLIKNKVQILKKDLSLKNEVAFYDVPLLFEKKMQNDFDAIVGVFANPDVQFERISERNKWSKEEIESRLKNQMPNDTKIKQCDFVITNNLNIEDLKNQVRDVVAKLITH